MTSASHIFRQFAAALALVMITSVALPVVASACETMRDTCPMAAQEQPATPPCHDDPAEAPVGDHLAICCAPTASAVFDEATILERYDVSAIMLLASHEAFTAPRAAAIAAGTAYKAACSPPLAGGIGLQVLYRALLN